MASMASKMAVRGNMHMDIRENRITDFARSSDIMLSRRVVALQWLKYETNAHFVHFHGNVARCIEFQLHRGRGGTFYPCPVLLPLPSRSTHFCTLKAGAIFHRSRCSVLPLHSAGNLVAVPRQRAGTT